MPVSIKLASTYVTDEVTEERMPNAFGEAFNREQSSQALLTLHLPTTATDITATVRLQHADAIEGPYEDVPGCTLSFTGPGNDSLVVEIPGGALKDFLAPQNFADGSADGGADVYLIQ